MTKEKSIGIVQNLAKANADIGFSMKLEKDEFGKLVACISQRADQIEKKKEFFNSIFE